VAKKCPEVAKLDNYRATPDQGFWDSFPSAPLPQTARTRVNIQALKQKVAAMAGKWTRHQVAKAARTIKDLEEGASAFQKVPLPAVRVPNAESAFVHGEMVTDSIGHWVKKGILAGPFKVPPLPHFRSNSISAIAQKGKVRLVLDMSRPKDRSFNSNLSKPNLDKVAMSTAKSFSYTLKEAGRDAIMSKQDMDNAYKLVPAKRQDWRLQGMSWLGRYFIESQMVFGASSSVANYDALSKTVMDLAISSCGIPRHWVHRTLDDVPVVAPANTPWTRTFTEAYISTCRDLDILLASPCPLKEKAFSNETEGRVLGIWFHTPSLSWSYPADKLVPLVRDIQQVLSSGASMLRQFQKILGSINDVAQMCPFLKAFRKPANDFMTSFKEDTLLTLPVPGQVKLDLAVCQRVILSAGQGLPIASRPSWPPLDAIIFTSDAAGAVMQTVGGAKIAVTLPAARGAASVSLDKDGQVLFACRVTWPSYFLNEARDGKGSLFGCKSTTLELIGLLLPFLSAPSLLAGRHIVLQVDSLPALFGWESRQVKGDISASILIRALRIIEALLPCKIHVRHLPRLSSPAGTLADHLSREDSSSPEEEASIQPWEKPLRSRALQDWLLRPVEDWDLANRLLADTQFLLNE